MPRYKQSAGPSFPPPGPPWLAGALIGMTILTMAGSAITVGAGLALAGASVKPK